MVLGVAAWDIGAFVTSIWPLARRDYIWVSNSFVIRWFSPLCSVVCHCSGSFQPLWQQTVFTSIDADLACSSSLVLHIHSQTGPLLSTVTWKAFLPDFNLCLSLSCCRRRIMTVAVVNLFKRLATLRMTLLIFIFSRFI